MPATISQLPVLLLFKLTYWYHTTSTTAPMSQSRPGNLIPARHTWLTVFLPALLYYIFLSNKNHINSNNHLPSSSSSHGILSQLGLLPNHFTTVSAHLHVTSDASTDSGGKASPSLLDSIFPNRFITFEYIIQNVDEAEMEMNGISEIEIETETEGSSTKIQ